MWPGGGDQAREWQAMKLDQQPGVKSQDTVECYAKFKFDPDWLR